MKSFLKKLLILIGTALVLFYWWYPPLNIHSVESWFYVILLVCLAAVLFRGKKEDLKEVDARGKRKARLGSFQANWNRKSASGRLTAWGLIFRVVCLVLAAWIFTSLLFSPLFMARRYASRISVTTVDFDSIPPYSFNTTAIIDRDSAERLGDKVMGEMTDLVSQFNVSSEYNQISYQEGTYRVTPLAYDGFIKYLKNRSQGIPGYIIVNTTTGSTELIRLTEKIRYVPSAWFNENLYRKLRFEYPFALFGSPTFEIDEEGNPWYVCTTYTYQGFHSLKKVNGVILFDPVKGEGTRYSLDSIPSWVDRVFPESLVEEELNDYGMYQKGFFNSIFGQEGVIQTSEGYNYISKDGDIWLYTGMTSVVSDDSNVGFMLVNLRTHEAQYIPSAGADEYSVMSSAEGEVLNYGYTATFPVLVNIAGKPAYILSLKDSAGLVKMYAMVDAQDYQQVYTVKADKDSRTALNELIAQFSGGETVDTESLIKAEIVVEEVRSAVIGGETYVYILSQGEVYTMQLTSANAGEVLFLSAGDARTIYYAEEEDGKIIHSME